MTENTYFHRNSSWVFNDVYSSANCDSFRWVCARVGRPCMSLCKNWIYVSKVNIHFHSFVLCTWLLTWFCVRNIYLLKTVLFFNTFFGKDARYHFSYLFSQDQSSTMPQSDKSLLKTSWLTNFSQQYSSLAFSGWRSLWEVIIRSSSNEAPFLLSAMRLWLTMQCKLTRARRERRGVQEDYLALVRFGFWQAHSSKIRV